MSDPRDENGGGDLSRKPRRLREKNHAPETQGRRKKPPPHHTPAERKGFSQGLRLSGDFVGGVVAGFAVGWGFDKLTGWSPWGMIVFLLLGFAAGVLNVLRTLGVMPGFGGRK